jgi:hypothetical protein
MSLYDRIFTAKVINLNQPTVYVSGYTNYEKYHFRKLKPILFSKGVHLNVVSGIMYLQ